MKQYKDFLTNTLKFVDLCTCNDYDLVIFNTLVQDIFKICSELIKECYFAGIAAKN